MSKDKKNAESKDWRRHGQEKYLTGLRWALREYQPPSPNWDHDHCEFCWKKFTLDEEELRKGYSRKKGYCSLDSARWVCEDCFKDFKDEFKWVVEEPKK